MSEKNERIPLFIAIVSVLSLVLLLIPKRKA